MSNFGDIVPLCISCN